MTRRPVRRDRIEERAVGNIDLIEFHATITVALREIKWDDGREPPSVEEVSCLIDALAHTGLVEGPVALDWIKALFARVEHAGAVGPARVELARKLAQIRLGVGAKQKSINLTWCDWHGYTEPLGFKVCAACPCEMWTGRVYSLDRIGRPRRHCTNACRQRAYRQRRRDRSAGTAGLAEVAQ
ncbi:hypothetical protein [Nocardia sp. R7R-8]|uniref:hypothetical protein n=1 Tax=Nocardia sp. R7R-8 TaxID=3459304 RepID=UPI00403D71EC